MDDRQLRIEVTERMTAHYAPTFERMRARHEAEAAQSDEEWWQTRLDGSAKLGPAFAEKLTASKDEMIRNRHEGQVSFSEASCQSVIETSVNELMPYLLSMRRRLRIRGPLTDAQFHAASLQASLGKIGKMRSKIRQAAKNATDPRRKKVLSLLAKRATADLAAMKPLADPGVTEEQLADVTSKVNSEWGAMAERLRS